MVTEQQVRETIDLHIDVIEKRIAYVQAHGTDEQKKIIEKLEYAVSTLIHVQHDLRLCDCPDGAYNH